MTLLVLWLVASLTHVWLSWPRWLATVYTLAVLASLGSLLVP